VAWKNLQEFLGILMALAMLNLMKKML